MAAYYNENNPKKVAALHALMADGFIAKGEIDDRSILDVRPDELRGFTQIHLFAGVGIWSYAFRLAGWPDHREVWSFSCPCQPFSEAGKGAGFDDERHLWPAVHWLIRNAKSPDIPAYFEQVANGDGLAWLDLVSSDLEAERHTCRAFDLCAAGVGAPHVRQRLYGVANSDAARRPEQLEQHSLARIKAQARAGIEFDGSNRVSRENRPVEVNGFWRGADWLCCADGSMWPVEPGSFVLAHGYPERIGLLHAAGDGICAPLAAAFIKATMTCV